MNDTEEQQEQEQQEQNSLEKKVADAGKDAARQGAKAAGKAIGKGVKAGATKVIAMIGPYLIPVIAVILGAILLACIYFAVQDKIKEIGSNIKNAIASVLQIGDNGPLIPSTEELLQNIDTELENNGIEKEDLSLGNEEQANAYLYKYMVASLSTQLPYVEDSTAEKITNIALHLNPITGLIVDWQNSQEVQGIVKIYRCTQGSDNKKALKYLPYGTSTTEENATEESDKKTFSKLVEENDPSALDYFSIDENWMLCIATYVKVTVSGTTNESTYTLTEEKIPYQTMISNYSMPFSFFITLQQITQNAEYVSAVADMVLEENEIEITLYDTIETITSEYTYKYDLKRKWIEEIPVAFGDESNTTENNPNANEEPNTGENTTIPTPGAPATPTTGVRPTITDRASMRRIATAPLTEALTGSGSENAGGSTGATPVTDSLNGNTAGETTEGSSGTQATMRVPKEETIEDNEETTTTITETNTITANVTKANVWVIEHIAEYVKDESPEPEYPLGEDGITTELEDETEPEGDEGEWKINQTETTKETKITNGWKIGTSETKIEPDVFLGLWKNFFGTYIQGAKYDPNGKLVEYNLPGSVKKTIEEDGTEKIEAKSYEIPVTKLLNAEDMFYTLLEKSEDTQLHAQIMREIIAYYKADGNYAINIDLSIFDTSEFTGAYYGSSTAKDFIHYFEGTPKQTADGSQYVVFDDGAGNLTVGWGVYIDAHKARFAARGINASSLKEGSTVDKTIVDSIEDEIIEEYRNKVIDITQGLNLEEYQIDALTSRVYNCGTGGLTGFAQAYNQYGNTDALYTNFLNKPVTSKGKYLPGLEKRRQAEWNLFHTGYYINTNSYYSPQSAASSSIVDKAKQCHDFLRNNGFKYEQAGQNIPITSTSKRTIDCSSFVSWVLYEAGYKEFAGYQKTSSYFAANPMNWQKISKDNLQPGDIMVFSGHVQIYAGDGKYYNCGGKNSIEAEAPSGQGKSANDSSFLFGLRPN